MSWISQDCAESRDKAGTDRQTDKQTDTLNVPCPQISAHKKRIFILTWSDFKIADARCEEFPSTFSEIVTSVVLHLFFHNQFKKFRYILFHLRASQLENFQWKWSSSRETASLRFTMSFTQYNEFYPNQKT